MKNEKYGNKKNPKKKHHEKTTEPETFLGSDNNSDNWQTTYWDYRKRFVDDCIFPLPQGRKLTIAQAVCPAGGSKDIDSDIDPVASGTTVWDGGLVLAQYLTGTDALECALQGKENVRSLELGAGTGLVTLSLAVCGKIDHGLVTDLPSTVAHLQRNVDKNKALFHSRCRGVVAMPYVWGEELAGQRGSDTTPPDLVLGSDLIYYSSNEQANALCAALRRVCGERTVAFFAFSLQHQPDQVSYFVTQLESMFSSVREVTEEVPQHWRFDHICVYRAMGLVLTDSEKKKGKC